MSDLTTCRRCNGNIVRPAYDGDGAYPISPMCQCAENQPNPANYPQGSAWNRREPPQGGAE